MTFTSRNDRLVHCAQICTAWHKPFSRYGIDGIRLELNRINCERCTDGLFGAGSREGVSMTTLVDSVLDVWRVGKH